MTAKLLIVDDESEIREALSRHLRFLGYEVSAAVNGQEALDYLSSNEVDVVITDIVMPVLDGVGLLRVVKQQYPMVRVIIITGYVTQENVLACMRHHAETCIYKPWSDLKELEGAVAQSISQIESWKYKCLFYHGRKKQPPANSQTKRDRKESHTTEVP